MPHRFQSLFRQARDAMVITTPEGRILEANPACLRLFALDPAELERYSAADFYADPAQREQLRELLLEVGEVIDFEVELKDVRGRRFTGLYTASVDRDADGTVVGFHGTVRDLSQQRAAETELTRAEVRLKTILDTITDAVVLVHPDGFITYANATAEDVLGITSSQAAGRSYDDPRWKITDVDGGTFPDERLPFVQVMRTRAPVHDVRHAIHRPDGRRAVLSVNAAPILDEDGSVAGVVASVQDVTERVRLELEAARLRAGLEQRVRERTAELSAANRELEAFAYSVSHDLRQPLRALDGFSQALVEDYGEQLDEGARTYLARIQVNSRRMAQLVDDLLALSRISRRELVRDPVDLVPMALEILAELKQGDPGRDVAFTAPGELVAVGDPSLLRILLENLLGNAWKFTSGNRDARVELGVVRNDGEPRYFVRDNGVGFDMAFVDKLFQPFHRLHSEREFEGTGIGLATVDRIVRRHGGQVRAEGAVHEGATIWFSLGEHPG